MAEYANEMQRCYVRQAEAVYQAVTNMPGTLCGFKEQFAKRHFSAVLFLGIGSSYHALNMARAFAQDTLGIPVWVQTPEQTDWINPSMAHELLIVAASQSGTSTNVLARLRELHNMGIATAAITQNVNSPIAGTVDCVLPLHMPEEKAGPKTMGVMTTALTAAFAACALCDDRVQRNLIVDCSAFCDELARNLIAVRDWAIAHAQQFAAHHAWIVVSQKRLHACAGEAALKLVETVRRPTVCYELEEIVHGPNACLSADTALLYMGTEWEERKRAEALLNLCCESGGAAYDILATQEKTMSQGNALLLNAPKHELLTGLMLLLPAQAISAWVPAVSGINLDANEKNKWKSILAGHL